MPLAIPSLKTVPSVIPANTYPHLREIVHQLDFKCQNCTHGHNQEVYVSWAQATKWPMSSPAIPGKQSVGPKGMIATVFQLTCPNCNCILTGNPYINDGGVIDLLAVDKNYRKPVRALASESNATMEEPEDDEAAAPAARQTRVPKALKKPKKDSDLNPKSRRQTNKEKKKASQDVPVAPTEVSLRTPGKK